MTVRLEHLAKFRRHGRGHVQHFAQHGDEIGPVEVAQRYVRHGGLAPPGQQGGQRVGRVDVAFPVRSHQQQALRPLVAQHHVHEAERDPSAPLQVVDEYHERASR